MAKRKPKARNALTKASPIRTADLDNQQFLRTTSSLTVNYNSVNTLDPARLAAAFAQADLGYITDQAVFFELIEERDTHLFAEMSKRRRSVTGLGWQIEAPNDATQAELDAVKELSGLIESIPRFEEALYDITDAIGKGFSALEIDWQTGSTWYPKALNFVPQRNFKTQMDGSIDLYIMGQDIPLRPYGWVIHKHVSKSGYLEQQALFRVLAWAYAYKTYNTQDMQKFLENYGMPLRLGKYPMGSTQEMQQALLRAVRNIGHDGAGVVPSTMAIDFVEAKQGHIADFMDAIHYWERKQSLAILGGTLTSQADGKSSTNALGMIHNEVRREIMLHDVRQIVPTINKQLIEPICLINGLFSPDRLPQFVYDTEETVDQSQLADVYTKATLLGLHIPLEYAHKTLQIPKAKEGEPILKLVAPPPASTVAPETQGVVNAKQNLSGAAALAALNVQTDLESPQNLTAAKISTILATLGAQHEQALLNDIYAALTEVDSIDAALDALEQLAVKHKVPNQALQNLIASAITTANLIGRNDVKNNP